MWQWVQSSGQLLRNGIIMGRGYAGHGIGLNNPDCQSIAFVGPLPAGLYAICQPQSDGEVGQFALPLLPDPNNKMFGRGDFYIHGDEIANPGQHKASDGCVVLDHATRVTIWGSGDRVLWVVPVISEESLWT
jgi:hypothetical protein